MLANLKSEMLSSLIKQKILSDYLGGKINQNPNKAVE